MINEEWTMLVMIIAVFFMGYYAGRGMRYRVIKQQKEIFEEYNKNLESITESKKSNLED